LDDHPAFKHGNYTAQGQPADGNFQEIWDEVRAVQDFFTRVPSGPHSANQARNALRKVVKDTGNIENAVCLGLGEIKWRSKVQYKQAWVQQCGMFFAVCQLLEQQQGMTPGSLPKVFQDPMFGIEERYILERIGHQTIIETPAANDMMNPESFVFAPHFPAGPMIDIFLTPNLKTGLLYTNTVHGTLGVLGWPIIVARLTEVHLGGNPTAEDNIFQLAKRFVNSHEGRVFKNNFTTDVVVQRAFSSSSFYLPKHEPAAP
jgi:hypothetical protein